MRLCLVAPPTIEMFEDGAIARTRVSREIAEQIPLGILSLTAVLEQHSIPALVVDLNQIHSSQSWPDSRHYREVDYCSLAVEELSALEFDVIGFSTMCSTYPLSLRIARELRHSRPDIKVILGGPQATVVDEATLAAFPFVDCVVRGEAEETLPQLLEALDDDRNLIGIPGVTYRDGRRIVRNANAPVIQDLDSLPLPSYHRFARITECGCIPLELGRGCPFACTFCSTNDFFRRRFRLKSPAKLIEQMSFLERTYGMNKFELVHDMFTVDRRRVVSFCEALLQSGRKFTWSCSARTDSVDDSLLSLMAEAGCRGIFFGVETGSARMQKLIQKNLDVAEASGVLESAGKAGIKITAAFIDGYPEERREDLADTADFIMNAARLDHVSPQINILAPLAKTPLFFQHRDQFVLDEDFSDMSHQGWRQDPADLELIAAHPDIFPNFYGVPSLLGRGYVSEFNRFLMNALARFRWLLIALHQHSGGLLNVFDEWRKWKGHVDHPAKYYCTVEFCQEFKAFLRRRHLIPGHASVLCIRGLLAYYDALDEALSAQGDSEVENSTKDAAEPLSLGSYPKLTRGTYILKLDVDVTKIIDHLRSREPIPDDVVSDTVLATRNGRIGEVELYRIPALSAQILHLCDGARDVESILRQFSDRAGITPRRIAEAVCLEGLTLLSKYELIESAGAGVSSAQLSPLARGISGKLSRRGYASSK